MRSMLLDTHTFLWAASERHLLSAAALELIEDTTNTLYLSIASVWELSIKVGIEKIKLPQPPELFIRMQQQALGFHLLPISLEHAARVATLPMHHRDPFDRLLVAQALTENMPLLSADAVLDAYSVVRYW